MTVAVAVDGWQRYKLRDVVTKLVDGSHNPPPKQDQGRPMLSARNVDQGRINFDEFRFISNESFDTEDARTRVAAGDDRGRRDPHGRRGNAIADGHGDFRHVSHCSAPSGSRADDYQPDPVSAVPRHAAGRLE